MGRYYGPNEPVAVDKGVTARAEDPKVPLIARLGTGLIDAAIGRNSLNGMAAQAAFRLPIVDKMMRTTLPADIYMYGRHLYGTGKALTELPPKVLAGVKRDINAGKPSPLLEHSFGAGLKDNEGSYPPGQTPYEQSQNAYTTNQVAEMRRRWPTAYTLGTYQVESGASPGSVAVHDYYDYQTGSGSQDVRMTPALFWKTVYSNPNPLRWLSAWGRLKEVEGNAAPYPVDVQISDPLVAADYNRVMGRRNSLFAENTGPKHYNQADLLNQIYSVWKKAH